MIYQRFLSTCFAVLVLALPASATAGTLTLTMTPSSQNVTQGGSGYVLNFTLTTTASIELNAFNVSVTTDASSGINFTGGDSSVTDYILDGNSLGLVFDNPSGNNTADINDYAVNPTNTPFKTVAAGTYGLGEIFFSVAANAPTGNLNITLDSTSTSFNDSGNNPISYTVSNTPIGTVNVSSPPVVPEPSSLVMSVIGITTGLVSFAKRRRMTQKA